MYTPVQFEELRVEAMHELMRARPFATVVTVAAGGIDANHIPLHLSTEAGGLGVLSGHVARANAMWRESRTDLEVLAVFQGPDSYVSPSWYATKVEHGRAVPTWNYAVVHAYGTLRVVDDREWLRGHLDALTAEHEARFPEPWSVSDAPPAFIDKLLGAVVGIEIEISRLVGKWKVSQNQPVANRIGVIKGLEKLGSCDAQAMAELVGRTVAKGRAPE